MIKTFADKRTAALSIGQFVKSLPADVAVRADQWRICFRWVEGHAYDVEFCDYH